MHLEFRALTELNIIWKDKFNYILITALLETEIHSRPAVLNSYLFHMDGNIIIYIIPRIIYPVFSYRRKQQIF